MWSQWYGGNGGVYGQFHHPNYSLVSVSGSCAALVNSLCFQFVDIHTGVVHKSILYGKNAGSQFHWSVPKGQWVTKVAIQSGLFVDALQFVTNTGQTSLKIGGNGGSLQMIETNGKRICGVAVHSGQWIDRIAFMLI